MDKNRRNILLASGCGAIALLCAGPGERAGAAEPRQTKMDVLTAIKTRRSVREYAPGPVSDEELDTILAAGMSAPSAANEQPWEFVVIKNGESLAKTGEINHYAPFAKHAPLAILLCLNERKEKEKGMGIIDMGTCAENMLLAAHGLGLGAVFTGIYPVPERISGFRELCGLPDYVVPIGLIVVGRPKTEGLREAPERFNKEAIHSEKWMGKKAG